MAAVGASSEGALPLHLKELIIKNGSGKMWHIALGPKTKRSRTRIVIGTDVTTLTLDKIRSELQCTRHAQVAVCRQVAEAKGGEQACDHPAPTLAPRQDSHSAAHG